MNAPSPDRCYFCDEPATDYLCRVCSEYHTHNEVAAKRLMAAILRHPAKGTQV